MINIYDEKNCCGCATCSVVCPKQCISMESGTLGSLFPRVNKEICISCDMCLQVCPILNKPSRSSYKQSAYAAYSNDKNIRFRGSSGGMFETFSKMLLLENYIIYGAAFDDKLKLKCSKAETEDELRPLLKSKYLQSDLSDKFKEIKNNLENNRNVLFVSTPCQVAALKLYLKEDYSNLFTVDFFCHGVPSQKFFDDCTDYDEKKYNIKIKKFVFREKKKNGTSPHYFSINDTVRPKLYFNSTFYRAFQKYICLRESCYECQFFGKERYSDITIGDFHEIDKYIKGINRFDGVSTVIINTVKGETLWEKCNNLVIKYEVDLNKLIKDKVCFSSATRRPKNRDEFIRCYTEGSMQTLVKNFIDIKKYWIYNLYYNMPKFIRNILKKFIGVQ